MGNGFLLAAHTVQQLAVLGHGLNQILSKSVLHNINTSKIGSEKFVVYDLGAANRSPQAWRYYSIAFALS